MRGGEGGLLLLGVAVRVAVGVAVGVVVRVAVGVAVRCKEAITLTFECKQSFLCYHLTGIQGQRGEGQERWESEGER